PHLIDDLDRGFAPFRGHPTKCVIIDRGPPTVGAAHGILVHPGARVPALVHETLDELGGARLFQTLGRPHHHFVSLTANPYISPASTRSCAQAERPVPQCGCSARSRARVIHPPPSMRACGPASA